MQLTLGFAQLLEFTGLITVGIRFAVTLFAVLVRTFTKAVTKTLFAALLMPASAWAWPPTYGAEFELSNDTLMGADSYSAGMSKDNLERKAREELAEAIIKKCAKFGCKMKQVVGKWDGAEAKFEFSDGWWFQLSHDPGVVEVMIKPSTLSELKARRKLMNELLFETAADLDLRATTLTYGPLAGHFNFGIQSTFGNDAELFLRFFVDYANHPFLALGALGFDLFNAPPLILLEDGQQEQLRKIINEFSSQQGTDQEWDLKKVGLQILSRVYTKSVDPLVKSSGHHYQAFSIKKLPKLSPGNDVPAELRAIYAQSSMDDFILLGEWLEARVAYLKKIKEPIKYNPPTQKEYSLEESAKLFREQLNSMNLPPSRYESLLPVEVRKKGNRKMSCKQIFSESQ